MYRALVADGLTAQAVVGSAKGLQLASEMQAEAAVQVGLEVARCAETRLEQQRASKSDGKTTVAVQSYEVARVKVRTRRRDAAAVVGPSGESVAHVFLHRAFHRSELLELRESADRASGLQEAPKQR